MPNLDGEVPKVLLFDIETEPHTARVWGKYQQDVLDFVKEGGLLCFAYKWLNDRHVHVLAKNTMSERSLVSKLHGLFDEADVVIAHNGDGFDIGMSQRLFAKYDMSPPSPFVSVDTKKIAKRYFRFTSNKLDDLGEYLGLGRKIFTGGYQLWLDIMDGNKKQKSDAWKLMIEYNKQDVVLLEKVYLKLRPWIKNPIRAFVANDLRCPACGSGNIQKRGFSYTATYSKQRFYCTECGHWGLGQNISRIVSKEFSMT